MATKKSDMIHRNSVFIKIALVTLLLLLVPLLAMQLTDQVQWTLSDFIIMGALLFGAASVFVLIARHVHSSRRRLGIGVLIGIGLLYVWAELAVGIFTNLGS